MGARYARLFCGTLLMNFFVLLLFTGGRSTPVPSKQTVITDVMKSNTELCNTTNFLYDSDYVKPCASLPYPTVPWNLNLTYVNTPLCLGMYDTAYKICQYSSRLQINSTEAFNLGVEKFIPGKNQTAERFCQSLQGFTPTYNKIESLWRPLVEHLLNSTVKCQIICYGLEDKIIHPLCALLAWNNHFNDTVNIDTTGLKPSHLTFKLPKNQSNSETTDIKSIELKIPKTKEIQEYNTKQTSNDNNNAEDKSNSAGNIPSTNVNPDVQKPNPHVEAPNSKDKTQTKNNTSPETQAPKAPLSVSDKDVIDKKLKSNAESAKSVSNPQTSSINVASENTKKYVDEDKIEELNKDKDQDIDDVKPTTLSENTQEHYDVNPEDDPAMDSNDDIEDTNQQSIDAGNQNENAQEPYEQKTSTQRFPRLRSDDSHFFTYFTVMTLACIAGYIGYHNKQKILAIVLEGRRSRNSRSRRRPSTANYRKLDCTLEEAVTSQCNSNVTHVIY